MSTNYNALKSTLRAVLQKLPDGQERFVQAKQHFLDQHATATEAVQFIIINLPREIRTANFRFYELLAEEGREACHELIQSDPESMVCSAEG